MNDGEFQIVWHLKGIRLLGFCAGWCCALTVFAVFEPIRDAGYLPTFQTPLWVAPAALVVGVFGIRWYWTRRAGLLMSAVVRYWLELRR